MSNGLRNLKNHEALSSSSSLKAHSCAVTSSMTLTPIPQSNCSSSSFLTAREEFFLGSILLSAILPMSSICSCKPECGYQLTRIKSIPSRIYLINNLSTTNQQNNNKPHKGLFCAVRILSTGTDPAGPTSQNIRRPSNFLSLTTRSITCSRFH